MPFAIDPSKLNTCDSPTTGQPAVVQPAATGADKTSAETTQQSASQVQGDVQTLDGGATLAKMTDGTFRLELSPNDPDSTVYTGKSEMEVLAQLAKGKAESDRAINDLKSRQSEMEDEDVDDVAIPDERKLQLDFAGRNGVDPQFLTFSDEQWDDYAREHPAIANKMMNRVDQIKQAAHNEVAKAQTEAEAISINGTLIDEEVAVIEESLQEQGLDPSKYVGIMTDVEKKVLADVKNYKGGVLRPAVITNAFYKAIRTDITKTEREKIEKEIAEKTRLLRDAGNGGSSAASFSQGTVKHKSTEDAADYLKAHYAEMTK